jgi:hypothetical protein
MVRNERSTLPFERAVVRQPSLPFGICTPHFRYVTGTKTGKLQLKIIKQQSLLLFFFGNKRCWHRLKTLLLIRLYWLYDGLLKVQGVYPKQKMLG